MASAYDFAEKLLATQRQFAEELMKVTAPLMPGRRHECAEGEGSRRQVRRASP